MSHTETFAVRKLNRWISLVAILLAIGWFFTVGVNATRVTQSNLAARAVGSLPINPEEDQTSGTIETDGTGHRPGSSTPIPNLTAIASSAKTESGLSTPRSFLPTVQPPGPVGIRETLLHSESRSLKQLAVGLSSTDPSNEIGNLTSPLFVQAGEQTQSEITRKALTNTAHVILVTGFEPFGGREINSSWEAVRTLEGMQLEDGRQIVTVELPVLWDSADDRLREAIDYYKPEVVINVGQGGYGSVSLELNAHNYNAPIPDNDGLGPPAPYISETGPEVFSTEFDLDAMYELLTEEGLAAQISTSAGSYLCNFVSYHSYDYLSKVSPSTQTMFVHVPPINSLSEQEELADIIRALEIIIAEASAQTSTELVIDENSWSQYVPVLRKSR